MNEERHKELESWADRELRSLPPRQAPAQLAARVQGIIALRQQHGTMAKRFAGYPLRWRLPAIALCLASVAVCVALLANVPATQWQGVGQTFASIWQQTVGAWGYFVTLLDAGLLLFRKVGQPAVLIAFLVFSALAATCAGLGTLCVRFATFQKEN